MHRWARFLRPISSGSLTEIVSAAAYSLPPAAHPCYHVPPVTGMSETIIMRAELPEAALEVISPDGARSMLRVDRSPFLIGRGAETGNHLQLTDRRISRQCAALIFDGKVFRLEDRGQKRGLFVNGEKAEANPLRDGDSITFGLPDSYEIIFRSSAAALPQLLDRMEHLTASESGAAGLRKLSLLLEATLQLHSHMPLDTILANMVDQAISLTDADRGLLLEPDEKGALRTRVARQRGGGTSPGENLEPSQTALRAAVDQKRSVVTEDVAFADQDLQAARSIIAQRLRAVVVDSSLRRRIAPGGRRFLRGSRQRQPLARRAVYG